MRYTALVMAGGRFDAPSAQAAGTPMKALATVAGATLLSRVLSALRQVDLVTRIVVVGPEEVRREVGDDAEWHLEASSLFGNVTEGARAAGLFGDDRVLLIGSDLAAPTVASLRDFLERSAASRSSVTVPLVARESFEAAYPGSPSRYAALREGEFTIGSQFTAPAGLLLAPPRQVVRVVEGRKSAPAMARLLGPRILLGLMTHSLTIETLERRASAVLQVAATAMPDCGADLALDVDDARDLAYARLVAGGA